MDSESMYCDVTRHHYVHHQLADLQYTQWTIAALWKALYRLHEHQFITNLICILLSWQ